VLLLERDERLGGRHTWSFHDDDLTPEQHAWVAPLVAHSWPRQEVRFPAYSRRLESAYCSITSESLRAVVEKAVGEGLRTGVDVTALGDMGVALGDGTRIAAGAVVDGRGDPGQGHLELGYQKFLGRTLVLEAPHGLGGPVLMDATVPQTDGFRFLYTLPFGERRLLVEDTRYSDTPGLDRDALRGAIGAYASSQGWRVTGVEGEEEGILPIVLSGDIEAFWDSGPPGVPRSGMRAALFHPTTGYSLPEAVRLADAIAASADLRAPALYALTRGRSRDAWRRGRFFRLLNRMLYRAAKPEERYRVLEHFYRLPEPLVGRFYAGRPTWGDKLRVLSGRPPVPVGRALRALLARRRPGDAVDQTEGRT
jgi:lycopene beta-cyclase